MDNNSTSGQLQPLASVSKTKLTPTQTTTDHNPGVDPSAKPVADHGMVDQSTKPQMKQIMAAVTQYLLIKSYLILYVVKKDGELTTCPWRLNGTYIRNV